MISGTGRGPGRDSGAETAGHYVSGTTIVPPAPGIPVDYRMPVEFLEDNQTAAEIHWLAPEIWRSGGYADFARQRFSDLIAETQRWAVIG